MAKTKPDLKTDNVAVLPATPQDTKTDNVAVLPATVPAPSSTAMVLAMQADAAQFAVALGVQLTGTVQERADTAAEHMSRSQRHMLAAGVLLMSVKAECEHGAFTALLAERGFEERAARRAMQYAEFLLSRPESEREALIGMKKSKVLALAGADPEVIEAMLANGTESIDALSVAKLHERIQELEAATTDLQVQRDTAETEAEGLRKRIKRGLPERDDQVPHEVADFRAEILALGRKASLALDSFRAMGLDLVGLAGTGTPVEWADATLRLAVSQLGALRLQLDGLLDSYLREIPGADPTPVTLSKLTLQEVRESALMFAELAQTHTYEKALREWQREQDRPAGKGRPKAKPVPPAGAAS